MEKIIRIANMHRHHKYSQNNKQYNNNQNRNQVIPQPTANYNHVINDLQDYMLYGKLLVQSLKTRSKINVKHKIMTTELAKRIIAETNSRSELVYVPYDEAYGDGFEDMERRVPNTELIHDLVGWKPKRDLSTMISDISIEMNQRF